MSEKRRAPVACQVCEGCQSMYGNPCGGCQAGGMCDGWLAQCNSGNCESERGCAWEDRADDDDPETFPEYEGQGQ